MSSFGARYEPRDETYVVISSTFRDRLVADPSALPVIEYGTLAGWYSYDVLSVPSQYHNQFFRFAYASSDPAAPQVYVFVPPTGIRHRAEEKRLLGERAFSTGWEVPVLDRWNAVDLTPEFRARLARDPNALPVMEQEVRPDGTDNYYTYDLTTGLISDDYRRLHRVPFLLGHEPNAPVVLFSGEKARFRRTLFYGVTGAAYIEGWMWVGPQPSDPPSVPWDEVPMRAAVSMSTWERLGFAVPTHKQPL